MKIKQVESEDYPFNVSCALCIEIIEITGRQSDRCQRCLSKRNNKAYVDYWLFNCQSELKGKYAQKEIMKKYLNSVPISKNIRWQSISDTPKMKKLLSKKITRGLQLIANMHPHLGGVQNIILKLRIDAERHIEEETSNIYDSILTELIKSSEQNNADFFYIPARADNVF